MADAKDPVHRLVLVRLDATSWRLCDRAVTSSDPSSLVAYVEQLETGRLLVIWVSPGYGTGEFRTLEDVLRAAVHHLAELDASRRASPAPIPHLPPFTGRPRATSRSA